MVHQFYNLRQNLGSSPLKGAEKSWILTAASMAASVGSSLFGGIKSAQAAKRARKENTYRTNDEKAWYDKEYNTDYLDTKAGQNLMRRAQETQDGYVRRAEGAAAVGGASDASVAQAKEAANKTIADTTANIAAQDTARKQQVSDSHRQNVQNLSRERQQIEQQRADNVNNAAQNASNALMSAATSLDDGGNAKGTPSSSQEAPQNFAQTQKQAVLDNATGVVSGLPMGNEPTIKDYAAKSEQLSDEAMQHRLNKGLYPTK